MSMVHIRSSYGVPARRGGRVIYTGGVEPVEGVILSERGGYLRIRMLGEPARKARLYHPTWEINYLDRNLHRGNGK